MNLNQSDPVQDSPVLRNYEMLLLSDHEGEANTMRKLDFQLRREGEPWSPYELSTENSPFLNFLHCAVVCQLAYLRMNASERGLRVKHVRGLCHCTTEDFRVRRFLVSFAIELWEGEAAAADLAYLRERCLACPVSRNLPLEAEKDTTIVQGLVPPVIA